MRPQEGRDAGFPPGHPEFPKHTGRSASRCSYRATWVRTPMFWPGPNARCRKRSGAPATVPGRLRSRSQSKRMTDSSKVLSDLRRKGILVMARGKKTIAEEAPDAYKDMDRVVECCALCRHIEEGGETSAPVCNQRIGGEVAQEKKDGKETCEDEKAKPRRPRGSPSRRLSESLQEEGRED